jgi:hypothetical protein
MRICGDGNRDKYSPVTEIKDGDMEYFGRRETGKLHPLISCPDIPKQSSLYNLIQAKAIIRPNIS